MPHLKKSAFSPVRDGTDDVPEDDGTGIYCFTLPADVDGDFSSRGHLPLLWLLVPLVLVFAVCFTFDWHAPVLGLVLLVAGGGASVPLAWRCPSAVGLWRVCFLAGVSGFALLLFAARVPPLPDWSGLPPREAELTVRWEQVFNSKPDAKTVGGVARVIAAPALLPELVGNDIYCQVRRPVPSALAGRGAVFTVTGVLDTARRQVSRGEDDGFLRYLEKRRATMALSRGRAGAVVEPAPPFQAWCSRQSVRIEGVLRRGLEAHPDEADLFTAILLGKTSGLSKEARTMFARTGTTHLFSVSGLHVGVSAAVLFWLGQWVRFPNTGWRVFVIAVMFVFVMITGGSAAALRAWLMVSCMLAARFVDRRSSPASGLVLAACGVLLWEPRLLLDVGFQLSYGIVAALVFYGLPLARWARAR
ncbi:MAG: ComEC/Rec2 family competence protein, partial [Puniceicoccales bacterium]|nr:ComEC/Rec2 family competence protein [Puniceicoccales bacterium]